MKYFLETSDTIQEGLGFSHFDSLHIAWLLVFAIVTVTCCLVYRLYGFGVELFTDLSANYLVLGISGAILAVISQIGDLIASLIKREHGVKDYSNLLPGHGGIMDRFDSILAVSTPLIFISLLFKLFS